MRKLFTIVVAILLTAGGFLPRQANAQAPEKMSYQAVIRDADGQLVTDTEVGVRIRIQKWIFGMPPSWLDVYIETHSAYKTNENGLLTLMIGMGEIVSGNFADIDWSEGMYRLKTETDPEGGTNYSIIGSSPLLSVPYALHAKNVKTYKVGDFAQGGIVFWVDETGQHGLVCAKEDQSIGVRWYAGTYGVTRATGDGPFSGELNTSIIISSQVSIGDDGADYAAQICNDLQITESGKTYGDWYLPSKEELNLMYQNKATIDATAGANGGSSFASAYYWSSTETSNGYAWGQLFDSGFQSSLSKLSTYYVRAIRAF
jgi:hypothetical protein